MNERERLGEGNVRREKKRHMHTSSTNTHQIYIHIHSNNNKVIQRAQRWIRKNEENSYWNSKETKDS